MTFFSKFICKMGIKVRFLLPLIVAVFFVLSALSPSVYAEVRNSAQIAPVKVAANNVQYNWGSQEFQESPPVLSSVKKRRRAKTVAKKRRHVRKRKHSTRKRKVTSQSRKRARALALKNRRLAKELRKIKKKDICGYPWVYAYKYKRCICERRGFAQLGNRCVRLSRFCSGGSVWSATSRKCICKAGFEYQNKQCVNVASLSDEDDEDDDDEEPPQLSGASCSAPTSLASLSSSVGECPDGYTVRNGKCQLVKNDKAENEEADKQEKPTKQAAEETPEVKKAAKVVQSGSNPSALQGDVAKKATIAAKLVSPVVVQGAPTVVSAVPMPSILMEPVYDLVQIRSCLYKAGFEGDRAGRRKYTTYMATYEAFKKFRERHQLTHKPMDIYDLESQQILFGLCSKRSAKGTASVKVDSIIPPQDRVQPAPSAVQPSPVTVRPQSVMPAQHQSQARPAYERQALAAHTIGSNDGYEPVQVTGATRPFNDLAEKPSACLPSDLYDFLTTTYGRKYGLKKCARSCLPAPETMSAMDKYSYGEKFGIHWCGKSCLNVSSYMPLYEVQKVERNANVQVCTNPTTSLMFSKEEPRLIGRSYPKARGLYRDFPESASNVNTIAVIIGNKTYNHYMENSNALNDAGAMFSVLSEHLDYSSDNIFDLRNATLEKMEAVLGSEKDSNGKLLQRLRQHPNSRVMIYYSGHALNNATNGKNYLLPIDAMKGREVRTGYSISLLLNNLRKLRASSIMLVLETEFSRKIGNAISPPNASEIPVQLQSSVPVPGLTIFMASNGNQKALEDPEYGIGLFTRHFIEGLAGGADRLPIGNNDGQVDVVELYVHSANMVRLAARKSFGLLQNPTLGQTGNLVISRLKTKTVQ